MTQKWTGDSAYGENHVIEFKHKESKQVVEVFAVSNFRQTEGGTTQVGREVIESRDLPVNRQEAESFIEQYLSDLNPEEKELVIGRLCTESDGFSQPNSEP
jgi:hypothetical protein